MKSKLNLNAFKRPFSLAVAASVLAACAYSIYFWINLRADVPLDDDFKAAAKHIKAEYKQSDFVAITPYWAFQADGAMKGTRRLLTQYPEKEIYSYTDRLWVVSIFGRFDEGAKKYAEKGNKLLQNRKFGNVSTYLFEIAEENKPRFDFVEDINQAEVYMLKQGHKTSCGAAINKRFMCSANEWNYVGQIYRFAGLSKRKMIWAHPVEDSLEIQFFDVKTGKNLLINTALSFFSPSLKEGSPVYLDVYIDGQLYYTIKQPNSEEMQSFVIPLKNPEFSHDVRFSVRAPDVGRRHFLFQAYTL